MFPIRPLLSICSSRRGPGLGVLLVAVLLSFATMLVADIVRLKNGNVIEGRIVEETDSSITISTGATELLLARSSIGEIERGFPTAFFVSQAQKSLTAGKTLESRGQKDEARRTYEAALVNLEDAIADVADVPEELVKAIRDLDNARRATLPPDPQSQRAEQLYEQALDYIDHVDYRNAFVALTEAAKVQPSRSDIQFRLARVATELDRKPEAISAYQATLMLDPETYYREASDPLLGLLKSHGTQLVNGRRSDEAIEAFQYMLLLEKETGEGDAVDLREFLARQTAREQKAEEEVLMEVYKYADDHDLIDLAFATISRVAIKKPDDPEVARLKAESHFLSRLKADVEEGDIDAAARLVATASEDLTSSEKVARRIAEMTGDMSEQIEARKLLVQAKSAFDREDYREAAALARRIATEFPETEVASEANTLLIEAELEAPVKIGLDKVRVAFTKRQYDEAGTELEKLMETERIEDSTHYNDLVALQSRIPREKDADRLYDLARAHLEQEEWEKALEVLEQVSSQYPETTSGKLASEWLTDYRRQLANEARKTELVEAYSLFAIADPNLWRAASYTVPSRDQRIPGVTEKFRGPAWDVFNSLADAEQSLYMEARSPLLHIVAPLIVGVLLMMALVWKFARPGKGRLREMEEITAPSDPLTESGKFDATHKLSTCRMCGLEMPPNSLICPHCDAPTKLSEIEQERAAAESREADYDPWESRIVAKLANDFHSYFEEAEKLAATSDVQAAIELCRKALREDPHRTEGYHLLADLLERQGNTAEAAECYREILLLDPADIITRQKVESIIHLADQPLEIRNLLAVLAFLLWWTVFWLAVSLDPYLWYIRLALCSVGAIATVLLWIQAQKSRRQSVRITHRTEADIHRPLPTTDLTWKEQNRQARLIAASISEHTGVDVPTLSTHRFFTAIFLSLLLLVVMVAIMWFNRTPWVLLGWPTGTLLFIYLLEIHPRALTAHVMLRHTIEETTSPWMDPHRPFKPKKANVAGEFLVRNFRELPLRWALNPFPYAPNRQGVLNAIQQTLNRHWACHRFYGNLHIVRDLDLPMPTGMNRVFGIMTLVLMLSLVSVLGIAVLKYREDKEYRDSMTLGYLNLLDGNLERARGEFFNALCIYEDRVLPNLYLAHVDASAHYDHTAERSFREATRKSFRNAVPYNDYGNFLQRNGRLREATGQYLKALEVEPENATVQSNLGSAYFKLKEYPKAVSHLRKATELDEENARAYTTLGLALEELGETEQARSAFEKAVAADPELPYVQIARDRLDSELRLKEMTLPELAISQVDNANAGSGM